MFINQKSLREQVYDYLRGELSQGSLIPGMIIDLNVISGKLGISKTPLRDALLQLDTEGFVTISPRRGIFVNRLTLEDIRDCYEIIGALESTAILSVIDHIQPLHLEKMRILNKALKADLQQEDYASYYQRNLLFHGVFLDLSHNTPLKRIIMPLKQRLYDFPRRGYIMAWELRNCRDHDRLIKAFEKKDREAAVAVWRDVHWSFTKQEPFIRSFYFSDCANAPAPATQRRRKVQASNTRKRPDILP